MKKYYQAALAVVAIISVTSLLFYRHEYNKLRYVLEVFTYFGKPEVKKFAEKKCSWSGGSEPLAHQEARFNEPTTAWQRLKDDLYIYSAHSIDDGQVHIIGLGKGSAESNLQCGVHFEDEPTVSEGHLRRVPIQPIQSPREFETDTPYVGYHFVCSYAPIKRPAASIQLSATEGLSQNVIIPIKRQRRRLIGKGGNAICVTPPSTRPMSDTDMLGFLNFHLVLGIEHFLIYDYGTSSDLNDRARALLLSAREENTSRTYSILPWNLPFAGVPSEIVTDIIQADCVYRTHARVNVILLLAWEEYLVPKYHRRIADLVLDLSKTRLLAADFYKLHTRIFCTDQEDELDLTNSTATIFRKTRFHPDSKESRAILINDPVRLVKPTRDAIARGIPTNLACVNRYVPCHMKKIDYPVNAHDYTILRFRDDLPDLNISSKHFSYEQ